MELCNLVNLDIDTIGDSSAINFGNTRILGDTFFANAVGGSETIGDFSNSFTADQNFFIRCKPLEMNKKTRASSVQSRKIKKKVVSFVKGKKTRSFSAKKRSETGGKKQKKKGENQSNG